MKQSWLMAGLLLLLTAIFGCGTTSNPADPSQPYRWPTGNIAGKVIVPGAQDHSGTKVKVGFSEVDFPDAAEHVASLEAVTRSDGTFRLENVPVGTYILQFIREGFFPTSSPSFKVEEGRTTTLPDVILATAAQGPTTIAGKVILVGEQDHSRVLVHASTMGYTGEAVTDAGGRFAISGIPPGYYVLRFTREGFKPEERNALVSDGQFLLLPEVQMFKNGSIKGRVIFQDGQAASRAIVILCRPDRSGVKTATDEEGVYRFLNVAPGFYFLSAVVPGHISRNEQGSADVNVLVSPGTEVAAPDIILSPGEEKRSCP